MVWVFVVLEAFFFCDRRITSAADAKPTTMVAVEAFNAIARNNTLFFFFF